MVQGLLALPRKSDTQTRAAQLFTLFSQAVIYCIPNILSQLACIISNTFSDMMYLNKAHNFCFIFYIPQCFTKISTSLVDRGGFWWRGSTATLRCWHFRNRGPRHLPSSDSCECLRGWCFFFCWKNLWRKNMSFFLEGRLKMMSFWTYLDLCIVRWFFLSSM